MMVRGLVMMTLMIVLAVPARAAEVGFARTQAPDPGGPPLDVAIWYPTASAPAPAALELFTQDVATDAPALGCCHPLVVISHGNGGSLSGHYDTALALARAGFVVAAVTHTGDNYHDHSAELRLADRPRQIAAVIDYVLSGWTGHAAVDAAHIGMFGYSAGGLTALVAIGGRPDLTLVPPYCRAHATTFVCRLLKAHGTPPVIPPTAWVADPRIKAAVIAAPALGFAFAHGGLRGVTVPIQLWAAADDHILPVADNALAVRNALPSPPEYHLVTSADHFDFLAPCSDALAMVAPVICTESHGFDRAAFHRGFDAAVVQFFLRTLQVQ